MKSSLSSLDIAALVAEIRPKLVDSWINNIYSIGKNRVILRFRKSTESPFELVFELGKRFHLTKYMRKKPSTPNNKVLSLRKHIRDLPVKNFYQKNLDRVVVFKIAYKDGFYKLVFELFGGGNLILVGPNGKIILAYNYRRMKDRDIHPGRVFNFPPSLEENITLIDEKSIEDKIQDGQGKLVSFLNGLLGLGPMYSKDILSKAKIDTKNFEDLNEEQISDLVQAIVNLKEIIVKSDFDCIQYLDEREVVEITPIPISRYDDLEKEKVDSFNNALDDFFSPQEEEPEYTEDKSEVTGKIAKISKTLKDQESHLKNLRKQEETEKIKGDLLYTHFSLVEELLTTIMTARKEGIQWKEIEEKLAIGKERGIQSAEIHEKLSPKSKQIWIKLYNDKSQENEIIELDFTKTITESANVFYEKSKKARRKIPGAEAAIVRTKNLIDEIQEKKEDIEKEIETKPLVVKRVKRWYEKFHWFLCGESIIIGGTDAKTNERILKTYLDDTDLFFHADVHGAPYVVIKDGQTRLSEECIAEVAIFALTYSSLWKDKKLIADVYHVLPDQVSLTPPSGQFIPKGGVMIYGEKKYSRNVEVNHAVGVIFYEQHAQFIGGPLKSIADKTDLYYLLKPGQISKGKVAKELMAKLLEKCPEEQKHKLDALTVNDLLPFIPGDSEIII